MPYKATDSTPSSAALTSTTTSATPITSNTTTSSNSTPSPPTLVIVMDDDLQATLRTLGATKEIEEARTAMSTIEKILSDTDAPATAAQIYNYQGLAAIMSSLERFQSSEPFVTATIGILIQLCHRETRFQRVLLELGMVEVLFGIVDQHHPSAKPIDELLLTFLTALCLMHWEKTRVTTDGCLKFVLSTLSKYPNDAYVNASACVFIRECIKISTVRARLVDRGVIPLLAQVYDRFRRQETDECKLIVDHSQEVLKQLV